MVTNMTTSANIYKTDNTHQTGKCYQRRSDEIKIKIDSESSLENLLSTFFQNSRDQSLQLLLYNQRI